MNELNWNFQRGGEKKPFHVEGGGENLDIFRITS